MSRPRSTSRAQITSLLVGLVVLGFMGFTNFEATSQRIVLVGALLIIFSLSLALIRIFSRLRDDQARLAAQIEERRQAEEALRELAASLEEKVAERTAVLNEAHELLKAELLTRTALEAELEQSIEELRVANGELEEFAYVASHDLQEPLRKIQAFANRLEAKHGDALDDQARDYLARMRNAAGRMSNLINDLLELSRITTRAQPFEKISLNEVIDQVLSDMEVRLEEEGARLEIAELPELSADPVQMGQLFQNLISNAVKFRGDEAPLIKIYAQRDDEDPAYFQIMVEDNGIGLDQKYADRIFTVFQRLHGRKVFEGSGIGLAICRKIVSRHGGDITVQSTPGKGATFVVTLPEVHAPPTHELLRETSKEALRPESLDQ